jgi:7-cyano-7-deazaguanine synthase
MAAGKALVLLSGGLDSATCLYWAKNRFSEVSAITFDYHGRIENERLAARQLAKMAGVSRLIEINLPFVKESSDYFAGQKMLRKGDQWASYVPARNMMFYSIAAYHAEFLGLDSIVAGHNSHDVSFFKDASADYIQKINELFRKGCLLCNGKAYRIVLPLARKTRRQVVRLALKLGTPIELTWSCHRNGDEHCGLCYACRQRIDAFRSLGMADPVFTQ